MPHGMTPISVRPALAALGFTGNDAGGRNREQLDTATIGIEGQRSGTGAGGTGRDGAGPGFDLPDSNSHPARPSATRAKGFTVYSRRA